jgi:hypothetical protein
VEKGGDRQAQQNIKCSQLENSVLVNKVVSTHAGQNYPLQSILLSEVPSHELFAVSFKSLHHTKFKLLATNGLSALINT